MKMEVKELTTEEDVLSAFPIMNELRTHLTEEEYECLVLEAMTKDRYQMFALFVEEEIVAVTGFKPMITLYYGRYVWICDLVTSSDQRSKGYGEKLISHVERWAADQGYGSVALSSGLSRTEAHRFYEEKMDYDKVSYVFRKTWGST
ncbi:GNAT family N-acetyltransferase [Halobacillus sp. H74]|uniref:GNAT family N-acetyltransferase n=1 Tax=Halobacillus sp. H74 TaxID=3457436 RepID=UPI003FCEB990